MSVPLRCVLSFLFGSFGASILLRIGAPILFTALFLLIAGTSVVTLFAWWVDRRNQ